MALGAASFRSRPLAPRATIQSSSHGTIMCSGATPSAAHRVSPRSLQTLVYTGELRSVILGRRIRRVLVSDLERYVREAVEMQSLTTTQQTTGRGRRKRREAVG